MARPRSPSSRDSPSERSPSSSKRSRLSSPSGGSPGGLNSIQSPSSLAASKLSGGHGTLRSDSMSMEVDEPSRDKERGEKERSHHRSSSDRDRHHRDREHRSDRDRHHRDRSRDKERERDRDKERDRDRERHSRDKHGERERERERDRDRDREKTRDSERSREHGRDRDSKESRDRHDSKDRRDRERGKDRDEERERDHGRDRDRQERSERSSSRTLDDRERSSTPTTGNTAASSTPTASIASPSTPSTATEASKGTMQPASFKPVVMTPQAPKIKSSISLSLSSNTPATTAPRAISAAFGDSDVIRKRRENVMQWRLEREAAKKAEEQAKLAEAAKQNPSATPESTKEPVKVSLEVIATPVSVSSKPWSFDDDDEEDENSSSAAQKDTNGDIAMADGNEENNTKEAEADDAMEEDEVDPLDAFMVDVTAEVKQLEQKEQTRDAKLNKAAGGSKSAENSTLRPPADDADEDEEPEESSDEEDLLAMAAKRIKKKDIPAVDHSKIQYDYFRKDFYLEPPELAEMTPEEVHGMRLELDGIKIRGADCPKPIRKWTQAGLPPGCMQVIKDKLNYAAPTSIQCQAIPAIMSGRDVIAVAKTGSGKTIAFILPMLRHIKDQRPLENMEGPIAIIMTPTRELAVQIHKECKNFLKVLNLRAVCAYGGSPIKDQIAELKRGAEIIVCTPGRLIDLLCANSGRVTNLRRTTFMVLDEADRMFDMGFEPQVMKIVQNVRPQRQVVLFSATFPKQMEALARKLLKRPLEITVGARSVVAEDVTQIVEVREDDTRFNRLLEILGQAYNDDSEARVLIFVSRQEAADNLLRDLMRRGYVSMTIHGGKDQVDRDSAISEFKAGVCQILIATSVAARGLDVKKLGIVINYECPNHMEDYVHRVGRTGRAGNKGIAYTFITPEQERFAPDIAKALTNSSTPVPPELQALVDSFHEKIKSGDAKQNASGFGGKGLEKFEKERDKVLAIQKKTYGAEDDEEGSDGEGGEPKELVLEIKQVQAGITAGKAAAAAGATTGEASTDSKQGAAANSDGSGKVVDAAEALRKAREAAEALSQSKGGEAKQRAIEVINNLNRNRPGADGAGADAAGSSAGGAAGGSGSHRDSGFAFEIEINDFPPKARLMVTQKMMINQISEHSGAAITTRGVFVEEGKQPPPGERKLYLFVEGDSQLVIDRAKNEIKRILAEEMTRATDAINRGGSGPGRGGGGRYQIL
ncbi:pre-mRNA processing RNA-helicase [Mortierella sp. AD094]|nr:pre-mRNA processing RNA-helicase [Mortierella sp. AD094]